MPTTLDDYEVLSTIGTGSYGVCKKIRRKKDGRILVWKELDYGTMDEVEKQMLVSEVNLLRELRHEHIVRYYDRIIDRTKTTLYIIMEYCEGGDLSRVIAKHKKEGRQIDEAFVWKVCAQMVSALKDCHSRKYNGKTILHRDLKPANVFLDVQNSVKLGDFGLARVLNHETSFAKTFVGTPYYMSPEQMNFQRYNDKSDIWSLGCLLYELCALRPPFTALNSRDLSSKICIGVFSRIPYKYSKELAFLIECMLQVEEAKRPAIIDISQHSKIMPYLTPLPTKKSEASSQYSSDDDVDLAGKLKALAIKEVMLKDMEKNLKDLEVKLKQRERDLRIREVLMDSKEVLLDQRAERLSRKPLSAKESKPLQPLASYNTFVKDLHIRGKQEKEDKENMAVDRQRYVPKLPHQLYNLRSKQGDK